MLKAFYYRESTRIGDGCGIQNSTEMCRRLLEDTGVAILQGGDFGRSPEELTARLAYVDFNGKAAIEALESRLDNTPLEEDFLKRNCGNVIEAIECICDWLIGGKQT